MSEKILLEETLVKSGKISKSDQGELVLISPEGQLFVVDETIIALWSMFDGTKTVQDIIQSIADNLKKPFENVEDSLSQILTSLKDVNLLSSSMKDNA